MWWIVYGYIVFVISVLFMLIFDKFINCFSGMNYSWRICVGCFLKKLNICKLFGVIVIKFLCKLCSENELYFKLVRIDGFDLRGWRIFVVS